MGQNINQYEIAQFHWREIMVPKGLTCVSQSIYVETSEHSIQQKQ